MSKRRKCSVDTRNVLGDHRKRGEGGNETSANEEEYLHDVRPRYGYEATINRVDARNQEQEKNDSEEGVVDVHPQDGAFDAGKPQYLLGRQCSKPCNGGHLDKDVKK